MHTLPIWAEWLRGNLHAGGKSSVPCLQPKSRLSSTGPRLPCRIHTPLGPTSPLQHRLGCLEKQASSSVPPRWVLYVQEFDKWRAFSSSMNHSRILHFLLYTYLSLSTIPLCFLAFIIKGMESSKSYRQQGVDFSISKGEKLAPNEDAKF